MLISTPKIKRVLTNWWFTIAYDQLSNIETKCGRFRQVMSNFYKHSVMQEGGEYWCKIWKTSKVCCKLLKGVPGPGGSSITSAHISYFFVL